MLSLDNNQARAVKIPSEAVLPENNRFKAKRTFAQSLRNLCVRVFL
jgi:hypothetical protein